MPVPTAQLEQAFRENERLLWDLSYRMTGSAADADDVVQDTFIRTAQRPPAKIDRPLRPWLVKVAVNAAKDLLRARQRRGYIGPWLPEPIETGAAVEPADPAPGPESQYGLLESATFAFLLALEGLTPQQRAVLILRDVFDYSVREVSEALAVSEDAAKATHLRARRAMASYRSHRCVPTAAAQARATEVLMRFFGAVMEQDVAAIERLLTRDARSISDGGGEFHAALRPIEGAAKVARLYLGLQKRSAGAAFKTELRMVNGLPAVVLEGQSANPKDAPRVLLIGEVTPEGLLRSVDVVLSSLKLKRIQPIA